MIYVIQNRTNHEPRRSRSGPEHDAPGGSAQRRRVFSRFDVLGGSTSLATSAEWLDLCAPGAPHGRQRRPGSH
jgi:hypothetical protein